MQVEKACMTEISHWLEFGDWFSKNPILNFYIQGYEPCWLTLSQLSVSVIDIDLWWYNYSNLWDLILMMHQFIASLV